MTGLVTWTFTSLDPKTLDLPMNPLSGFLPPNTNAPEGQGFVTYTVNPRAGLATGTRINAQATVVFDTNAPIQTAQQFNTIDSSPPTSAVNPLPATTPSTSFPISWSGTDGAGSGIASFNVYVSDDGAPVQPFLTGTTETSTTFAGQAGHTYAFYSVAIDNVGLVQPTPTAAQAATHIVSPPTSTMSPLPATTLTPSFILRWTGSPGSGATSIASYEVFVSDDGGPYEPLLTTTALTSTQFNGTYGHTYSFYAVATDNLGNRQPAPSVAQATTTVPALVTVTAVQMTTNRKHQATEVLVTFSGPLNATEAAEPAFYRLATAGKKGSFTAKNSSVIKLRSASYRASSNTVALIPKKPFTLAKGVQLDVAGMPPSGLRDSFGRFIAGGHDSIAILSRGGVKVEAVEHEQPAERLSLLPLVVDLLLERGDIPNRSSRTQRGARDLYDGWRR
jgi:hypothetical protein